MFGLYSYIPVPTPLGNLQKKLSYGGINCLIRNMENGTLIAVHELIFKNDIEGKIFLRHPPIGVPNCCSKFKFTMCPKGLLMISSVG